MCVCKACFPGWMPYLARSKCFVYMMLFQLIADCNLLPFSMYLIFYYVVYLQGNKMKQSYLSCTKGVFNLCDGPLLHLPKFRHVLYGYYIGVLNLNSKFEFQVHACMNLDCCRVKYACCRGVFFREEGNTVKCHWCLSSL